MLPEDPDNPSFAAPESIPETETAEVTEASPIADATDSNAVSETTPLLAPGYIAGPSPVPVRSTSRRGSFVLAVAVALVALLGGGALFLSGYSIGVRQAAEPGTTATDQAQFQAFWDAYNNIKDRYPLGPVDQKTLIEGAIKGMVESLGDPYSSYLTSEEFRGTLQDISGEFEGIGAEIGTVDATGATVDCATFGPNCRLVIVSPIVGSPAEKAGLKSGDVIVTVDGNTLDGLTPDEARDRIRGAKGTSVTLHIERKDAAAFDITIVRDTIQRQEVITRDLGDGSIGYVRLTGFSENGADAFVAAIKADVAKGDKKLVVDLRGNPGGFIDAARKVASAFIASGPVFWQEDAKGELTATEALPDGVATDPSIQVVVLIDKGSASASEIVAGAMQDTKRAKLVGEKSFGKGTVQQWIELQDAGGVKLTVAKWLTPNKTWIHTIGLTPDVPVTVPADNPPDKDPILDKALEVLSGAASVPVAWLRAA
jgi:carboxyl-terminal processing protease